MRGGDGVPRAEGGAVRRGRPWRRLAVLPLLAVPVAVQVLLATGAGPVRLGVAAAAGLSHAALYCGLAALFGASLLPGREALAARMARTVEPCCDAALLRYARGVTWLWFGFSSAQLAASALLLLLAPLRAWSAFVTAGNLPLVALVFLGEYAVRRRRFRGRPMATLADTVRAFRRRAPAARPAPGSAR